MTEACFLVATAIPNPDNMGEMKTYLEKASALLDPLTEGAAKRMKISEVVAGEAAALVMFMEFPSKKKLSERLASEEYQALIPGRERGFQSMNIWIADAM